MAMKKLSRYDFLTKITDAFKVKERRVLGEAGYSYL